MPVNGKVKGACGEREAAAHLTLWAREVGVTVDLYRNLEQTRGGGHDLVGLEDYGMAVEVKRQEAYTMGPWWKQAVRQGEKVKCIPVLMWRQNRKPWAFRVRVFVYPCRKLIDVDMELGTFRLWYQDQLLASIGAKNGTTDY